jgi:hypothetical protein
MLGHACLLCETEDVRILMDPWIVGPANFRSWWHLPDEQINLQALPSLDYIYVSHLHDDHFHVPTLLSLKQRPKVLVPRLYHNRLVRKLHRLGYTTIIELAHGKHVRLEGSTWVCCVQTGNDSMLMVGDSSASMLNANDALQGNEPTITIPLLNYLTQRYSFDIAFLAFGTAGAFPKCYQFEEPREGIDPLIKERAMLSTFVRGAIGAKAKLVVPFAGGFALLENRLTWMNEGKSTPRDAIEALRAKKDGCCAAEMNPGDIWDNRKGITQNHESVDWSSKYQLILAMRQRHSQELATIEAQDREGPNDLYDTFQRRLTQNLRAFPQLRSRLNCSLLFEVDGHPGGKWEVDLRKSSGWFREGDSGDSLMRIAIPSALFAEVLSDPDGWETLGISYKLNVFLKKGALAKEGLLNRLIYTPTPTAILRLLLAPRFSEFLLRRRKEFAKLIQRKVLASA